MRPLMADELKTALNAVMKTQLNKCVFHGIAIDSRGDLNDKLFIAIKGHNNDGHKYIEQAVANGAAGIVIDQDIDFSIAVKDRPVNIFKVNDSVESLGRLARYYRSKMISAVNIIAVTGSNGKTTTREMIYHVLARKHKGSQSPKNFNNAIGAPLSILDIEHDHDFAVIELGTNSPGEIHYLSTIVQPNIAVITTIGPSHLEGLKDIAGVCSEKTAITSGLKDKGIIICNGIHKDAIAKINTDLHKLITFGFDPEFNISASDLQPDEKGGISFSTNDRCRIRLAIPGQHNVSNALAALAVCRRMDITTQEFADAIADFNAVDGRLNIKLINGVTIIDDSYNANPASMNAALSVLNHYPGRRKIFCCGDMGELGEQSIQMHQSLGTNIAQSKTNILITAGELSRHTAQAASDNGLDSDKIFSASSSDEAAQKLLEIVAPGDVVLTKGSRSAKMEKVVECIKNSPEIVE